MGIKLDISEDYTSGQIAFDCQSIDDVRKIGDILGIVGFNMRFANIEIKDKPVNEAEIKILMTMVHNMEGLKQLANCLYQIRKTNKSITPKVEFILEHISENIVPSLDYYLKQIWPQEENEYTNYEFQLLHALIYLDKVEQSIDSASKGLTGLEKEEAEKLRRLVNFRYVQEIRQIIHDAKRLNMLRQYE